MNKIPGSSIQQVSPFEWVIFAHRQENQFGVTIGQYINTLTGHLPFPDRSPRPEISFNVLKEWNDNNRSVCEDIIKFDYSNDDTASKKEFLDRWHNHLVEQWTGTIKSNKGSKRWFDNTIRLFSLELLCYYNDLSDQEKVDLVELLKSKIK